jgi:hypothetical protein
MERTKTSKTLAKPKGLSEDASTPLIIQLVIPRMAKFLEMFSFQELVAEG